MPYTVQEKLALPEHLISHPDFSEVPVVSYLLFTTVYLNVFGFVSLCLFLGFDCIVLLMIYVPNWKEKEYLRFHRQLAVTYKDRPKQPNTELTGRQTPQ